MSDIPDTTVLEWAKRHGLDFRSPLDMRCAFDDAYSTPRTNITPSAAYIAAAKGLADVCVKIEKSLPSNLCDSGWGGPGDPYWAKELRTALALFAQQGGG